MRKRNPPDPVSEWRSRLSGSVGALLLFTSLPGVLIYVLPFSIFNQLNVIVHTLVGLAMILPVLWFVVRHWSKRSGGNFSHYQLLGYLSLVILAVCIASGVVLSVQGIFATRINYTWDSIHLITGVAFVGILLVHLVTVGIRKSRESDHLNELCAAQRKYALVSIVGTFALLILTAVWTANYYVPQQYRPFAQDYNWRFGEDRPFAPSLSRLDYSDWSQRTVDEVTGLLEPGLQLSFTDTLDQHPDPASGLFKRVRLSLSSLGPSSELVALAENVLKDASGWVKSAGAIESESLAGSESCGVAGCHTQIYQEWLPSAHRYSSMDDMFQRVQTLMAEETSPEHTRFCAGCHDPISLFRGAKNAGNITLSADGSNEGISCLVCHSITQSDVQGNGDYTVQVPQRYIYESAASGIQQQISHFLIRTYPEQHISSLARPLYKSEEFCAACHKQYMDKEVNTDIGKVQGQNQYDSWKNSRWYHEGDPAKTISCRECHMPLDDSDDPASGDVADYNRSEHDGKHRGHRFLASNQYIPILQNLEGGAEHVALTESWLRGEIDIPEIADKWTEGPVVRLNILAPEVVKAGDELSIRVILTNNKTGHDFPTGPLDMIESWIEVKVSDAQGQTVYHLAGDLQGCRIRSQGRAY